MKNAEIAELEQARMQVRRYFEEAERTWDKDGEHRPEFPSAEVAETARQN